MKVRGFTLIELIITLLIGSLLLAWGVPNYRDFKLRRQVVDNTNNFIYSLTLARSEAIRLGTDVSVEPVGGDWRQGWTITAAGVGGSADTLIQSHDPVEGIDLTLASNPGGGVTFNRIGGLRGAVAAQFELEHHQNNTVNRDINISLAGSIKAIAP